VPGRSKMNAGNSAREGVTRGGGRRERLKRGRGTGGPRGENSPYKIDASVRLKKKISRKIKKFNAGQSST
jgi:hypothetical protein